MDKLFIPVVLSYLAFFFFFFFCTACQALTLEVIVVMFSVELWIHLWTCKMILIFLCNQCTVTVREHVIWCMNIYTCIHVKSNIFLYLLWVFEVFLVIRTDTKLILHFVIVGVLVTV